MSLRCCGQPTLFPAELNYIDSTKQRSGLEADSVLGSEEPCRIFWNPAVNELLVLLCLQVPATFSSSEPEESSTLKLNPISVNLLVPELFLLILAHPVYKM